MFPVPKPLRSSMHPHGLDGLSGLDKQKCELANQVYQSTTRLLAVALDRGVRCVLENPVSSLFWQTELLQVFASLACWCCRAFPYVPAWWTEAKERAALGL